jgi:hypothetical protein
LETARAGGRKEGREGWREGGREGGSKYSEHIPVYQDTVVGAEERGEKEEEEDATEVQEKENRPPQIVSAKKAPSRPPGNRPLQFFDF